MVAKIISGKSIRGLLNYNEAKVADGQAKLIMASRFGTELDRLDIRAKVKRFEHLTSLNPRVKTNALHIMLNFDREDKLNIEASQRIATEYMSRIGFGEQPYLVYQHHDVSHPHLHIVTTNIKADGKRIDIHNIGKTLSEIAKKEIEKEFKLIKAEGRNKSEVLLIDAVDTKKVIYGITPTKKAINGTVSSVFRLYSFTSFAEYKAILQQFNILADRGKENSSMFEKRGLVYSIQDNQGKRVGIPFKASLLNGRPTLDRVEKKFKKNKLKRQPYKDKLKERIINVLKSYNSITKETFIQELQRQQINILFRQNKQGLVYGVTFVDHKNKAVFNGSDLGKDFSAESMMEQLSNKDIPLKAAMQINLQQRNQINQIHGQDSEKQAEPDNLLDTLLAKGQADLSPHLLRKKKKRKAKGYEQGQELTL